VSADERTADEDLSERLVDALNETYGVHPGHRAAHAKGVLCAATFTPLPEGPTLSRAVHFGSGPLRAHVRFSNGSGDPTAPDGARDGRGIAVKIYLPDGAKTDIVALSLPCFFVRTPEDFLEFTRARKDPERLMPDWLGAHPEALTAIQAALSADPPASYANCAYNSIHSFRWTDADGGSRFVRYRWEPEAGVETLSPEDAKARGRDYLQEDLLARGESTFRLKAIVATEEDAVDDPTVAWPEEREQVEVGRLVVDGPELERERDGDILVFDPTRVIDGIELSDDAILRFRGPAYSVSVERRS
jgi:catalase